ncbi:MAG: UDP-glucose/GDP-mannose dehydrogenase family protein [Rhodospirillales bacterium]|nr:UDP-glucose/GDP-mannose dehydrogenase family protein [Rhodospirillales bacterium]MBO6786008.1 UDP-glucose/GDP-mannose dehydrogenase family protein [Rhodospirillales bacterium]
MGVSVAYMGMTHLGLNSAAGALARGHKVICFDPDIGLIEALADGRLPVHEPDLAETFAEYRGQLKFSHDLDDLGSCDVVYVAPDVATDDHGVSDLQSLVEILSLAEHNAREDAPVVILSQVPPGFTRSRYRPDRLLYYQVETLVFGRAVDRARNPERFIVGCADPEQSLAPALHAFLQSFDCPILPMRFESAELAKIAINCFLVAQVTTTNTLAEICEEIGANWDEIAPALRLDERIGTKAYLSPGLGISGGNLERDLATVVSIGKVHDTDVGMINSEVENSSHRKMWASRVLRDYVLLGLVDPKIAVWGLAYKKDTHSVKNSPSIATLRSFPETNFSVHDPMVKVPDTGLSNLIACDDPIAAADGADCLMILTPWDEYQAIDTQTLVSVMRGKTIIDPFGVLNVDGHPGLRVFRLGRPFSVGRQDA